MFPWWGTHIIRDMRFPGGGTHITRVMCFPRRGTYITRDMCFLGGGIDITRDMCLPCGGTHITRDMCFPGGGTHITWAGSSKQNLQKLQLVQNFAARVLIDTKTFDHIFPVLWELGRPFIKDQLLVRDSTQQHQEKGQSKSLSMQNSYCSTVILLSPCTCLELSDRRH